MPPESPLTAIGNKGHSLTELRQLLEERTSELSKVNKELERSNLELEQFANVASHDLQEPLRKIQTFTNLLEKHNEDKLDADSKIYIEKILKSTGRLSNLIDDLLNFSRLSRPNGSFVKTDLEEIWHKVKTDFELAIRTRNVIINQDKLSTIEAVPLQMNQLFHNLLSNALKFAATDKQPVLDIDCSRMTAEEIAAHPELQKGIPYYAICFRDNGIGFEPEYAEKIFLIFQRLHGQYSYPGSGIGLALCRKIVLNHRGKIYATSEPGKGSGFHILLPEICSR